MRRDLIIALLATLTIFTGATVWSECFGHARLAPAPRPGFATIEVITLPKIEPDEEEAVSDDRPQQTQPSYAPPIIQEVFQVALDTSFVQPMQPPAPGAMVVGKIEFSMPPSRGSKPQGLGPIYETAKVDQIPEVIVQIPPDYPYQMRSAAVDGNVLVDCIVDTHGNVRNAFAYKSSRHEFDVAAVRAVNNWKFRPGQFHGHAVNTHVLVPITFAINRSPFSSGS